MEHRSGESDCVKFRADRFFCISGDWFFDSREQLRIGPFQARDEAEIELMFYLRHIGEGATYTPPSMTTETYFRI